MRYKMTKKYQICHHQIRFFQAQNASKSVFGRGSASDPAGGAYDAPPDPLVGWGGGYPSLFPSPLDAYGASVLRPPQHKILATPVSYTTRPISRNKHSESANPTRPPSLIMSKGILRAKSTYDGLPNLILKLHSRAL